MARGFLPISRVVEGAGYDEIGPSKLSPWLQSVVDRTTAVDEARKRQMASIVTQVNSIISNPPRYATVDDAVKDMRERTGLNQYIDSKKKSSLNTKQAKALVEEIQSDVPEALGKDPELLEKIINYVKNNVKSSKGLGVSVPQLMYDIKAMFGQQHGIDAKDLNSAEDIEFLSKLLQEEKSKYGEPPKEDTSNIGLDTGRADKSDESDNNNFFGFAEPAT